MSSPHSDDDIIEVEIEIVVVALLVLALNAPFHLKIANFRTFGKYYLA